MILRAERNLRPSCEILGTTGKKNPVKTGFMAGEKGQLQDMTEAAWEELRAGGKKRNREAKIDSGTASCD